MYLDEDSRSLQEFIRMCLMETRPDIKLMILNNICQMLEAKDMDDDLMDEVEKMRKFADELLRNPDFRRAVHHREALKEREPITYFGDLVPKGDHFDFNEPLEKDITVIDFKVTTFLGNIMRWMQSRYQL